MKARAFAVAVAVACAGALCSAARAAPAPFYKGKTLTIITSTGAGGTYDLLARMLARVMPRYIPGSPDVIVQNMPGAGNLLATNYMYNIAPKDGTTIATIHAAMPLDEALDGRGVRFDASRFNWIGSSGSENEVILVWHGSGVRTFADALKKQIILGTTGAGSGLSILPQAMNAELGTKFKLVLGYKSSEDINLAMERGEVQARAFSMGSIIAQHADWLANKTIHIIAQAGAKREADLPDVPLVTELAKDPQKRAVLKLISSPSAFGHPFVAPPGVPQERIAMLRKAFEASMRDPAFLKDAAKVHMAIDPTSGPELAALARDVVGAPSQAIAEAKSAIAPLEAKRPGKKKNPS